MMNVVFVVLVTMVWGGTVTVPITIVGGIDRKKVYVVSHGDERQAANIGGWEAQMELEKIVSDLIDSTYNEFEILRGHPYDPIKQHGFIDSQRMGIDVFKSIPEDAMVIVAISVWCYSNFVTSGLHTHKGPILLLANWSGQWPGLVGMLNLAGSLTKMQKEYSRLWTADGTDIFFKTKMGEWLDSGKINYDRSHIRWIPKTEECTKEATGDFYGDCLIAEQEAERLKTEKSILCVFDEGCMGMVNAIIEDSLMNEIGVYKERISQSYLVSMMKTVEEGEAKRVYDWIVDKGIKLNLGKDDATELTEKQVLEQMKMYLAVFDIAEKFSCDLVGIQYQQGLVHSVPASDLVEGMLNNVDRPPVFSKRTGEELYKGQPLIHFNEVDEGAALDALITNRIANAYDIDPATTLHDIRYGEEYNKEFVWVFEISGAVPPSHLIGGWEGSSSERQPPMYFPLGGGSLKGISKPGRIIWSRVYVKEGGLCADIGSGKVVELPLEETERRWKATTSQWPIMHAVLDGLTRDQMMSTHEANHIQVFYVPEEMVNHVLVAKADMMNRLGFEVFLVGK